MEQRISEFGKYQGYTEKAYDDSQRSSDYLTLSDGTRVAYDLFLPTKKGIPADKPLPVLFLYTPYLRVFTIFDKNGKSPLTELESLPWYVMAALKLRARFAPNGNLMDALFRRPWLRDLVKSGYAIIVAEAPGTGASFGQVNLTHEAMAKVSNEILNWIATQKWCDGNIGMFGDSIQAQVQFIAASTGNPHLKAIMPASTWWDNYTALMFPGGIFDKAFGRFFTWSQKLLDSPLITPVDTDKDGTLLSQALTERRNATTADIAENIIGPKFPFRDSLTPSGRRIWDFSSLIPEIDQINQSGIPVYLINGWYDLLTRDNFLIYANLQIPKRLLVRPTDHSSIDKSQADIDFGVEAQRWFDYWLKGIDNGIINEPPIHYYLLNVGKEEAWKTTDAWPLKSPEMVYYFGGRGGNGKASTNDGTLLSSPPVTPKAFDLHTVDYTTTTGKRARWTAVEEVHNYPNMRFNDAKALTYTTPPLEKVVQIIGHPVLHIWLSSNAPELDVFAYLEEVDQNSNSTYITEGNLRASHRALGRAPFENFGLPFHTHFKSDQQPIPTGEPVELVFDLLPTAYRFEKGKQIRITIAFADSDNFETPIIDPPPNLCLLRETNHPSFIQFPVAQSGQD
jgi:putative CocE/NonD family hydrolase